MRSAACMLLPGINCAVLRREGGVATAAAVAEAAQYIFV